MSRFARSIPPGYFDKRYAADPDPWDFETSAYERAKYDATLGAMPRARYASTLEIGCSIGVLTERLAERCDRLVALDVAEAALVRARERCGASDRIRFVRGQVPGDWPDGRFDLILLSEVVYYLDRADVARLAARIRDSLEPGGDVVLVHWTGPTHYPLSGGEAAKALIAETSGFLSGLSAARTDEYRLDVLRRRRP